MNDVVRATGLSRATVDRALNRRGGLHPETEQLVCHVYDQLRTGARPAGGEIQAAPAMATTVDAVFRMGRGMTEQLVAVRDRKALPVDIVDMHDEDEDHTFETVARMCRTTERPLIVTVKNSERMVFELAAARRRGKRVVALISDLSPEARDAYVGIDNRKAGQAAALIVGHRFGHRPAKVGVVLGDYAFRCHEDREIGFRSYLRSAFPDITLADVAKGDDSAGKTRDAALGLLASHPDLDAIYNVAGGNAGLAEALDGTGRAGRVFVVSHETNAVTLPLIHRGLVNFLIAQSSVALLETAMRAARHPGGAADHHLVDFTLHTPFNSPTHDAGPEA